MHLNYTVNVVEILFAVNNVGSLQRLRYFDEHTSKYLWHDVNINVNSMLQMTNMILPNMKKHKRGAIVNVSSCSSETPMAFFSLYTASKVSG